MIGRRKKVLSVARRRRRRKKKLTIRLIFLFLLFLVIMTGIIYFLRIEKFQVQKISIQGNVLIDRDEIVSLVTGSLSGKYLRVIPCDNIFILPEKQVISDLQKNFPRIRNISVFKKFPNTILVKIKERESAALLCKERDCAFVDERGFSFESAPFFSGDIYIKFFDNRDDSTVLSGKQILSQEKFEEIMRFANFVKNERINITDIFLEKEGQYKLKTEEGWSILVNERNNLMSVFDSLKIVLAEQIKERQGDLEYIDLRLENKIFYKFVD